jgi:integrase/recombinase XerD
VKINYKSAADVNRAYDVEGFRQWLLKKDMANNTLNTYSDAVRMFFRHVRKPFDAVTESDATSWIHMMRKKKVERNTQRNRLAALKHYYEYIEKTYDVPSPVRNFKPIREAVKVPNLITPDDFERLVLCWDTRTEIGRRNAAIICLMGDTGLRKEEVVAARVGDVKVDKSKFFIHTRETDTKTTHERLIPFGLLEKTNLVGEYWSAYYLDITRKKKWRPEMPLFTVMYGANAGKPIGNASVSSLVKTAAKRAEIPFKISPHSFRHFYATYSIYNGADIRAVQKILGHRFISTTERYVHLAATINDDYLRLNATSQLNPSPSAMTGFVEIMKSLNKEVSKWSNQTK